jgi:hypothetical protein
MGKGVQFRGAGALLQAYDNCKIVNWAVLYDKGINCKYNGSDETEARETLEEFLKLLSQSGSTAVYTLNLYEGLSKGAKILPKTEADYSFNFTLYDNFNESAYNPSTRAYQGTTQILLDRLTAIEAKLSKEEDDEEEGPQGVQGLLNGIIEDDRFKTWIQDKVFAFADKLFEKPGNIVPMNPGSTPPRAAARVGEINQNSPILIDAEQQMKAAQAVELLARVDRNLGDNLLKIARIAQEDPNRYKMLAAML